MTGPVLVVVGLVTHPQDGPGSPRGYVVTRRPEGVHLAGSWELPGGRVEDGESPEMAMRRELQEELGVEVGPLVPLTFAHHRYPAREVLLLFYEGETLPGGPAPQPLASEALEILTLGELVELPMPPANDGLVALLRERLVTSA